jgi:hypothetical protein
MIYRNVIHRNAVICITTLLILIIQLCSTTGLRTDFPTYTDVFPPKGWSGSTPFVIKNLVMGYELREMDSVNAMKEAAKAVEDYYNSAMSHFQSFVAGILGISNVLNAKLRQESTRIVREQMVQLTKSYYFNKPKHIRFPLEYVLKWAFEGDDMTLSPIYEVHFDTVIASQNALTMECIPDTYGKLYDCRFNEAFICPNIGRWMSFGANGGSAATDRWFRPVTLPLHNVVHWTYIRTYNHNIKVTLRFGKQSDNCGICSEPPCPAEVTVPWLDGGGGMRYFLAPQSITCMRID